MEKKRRINLPYYVSVDDISVLLEEMKNRPKAKADELKVRVRNFERSKSALLEFGLIGHEGGVLQLTEAGKKLAWETDDERRRKTFLLDVVMQYEPYEVALTHALREVDDVLDTDYVQRIWGQVLGIQLAAKNRAAAVATFFQFLQETGLGRYRVGRGGKPTRLEISNKEGIQALVDESRKTEGKPTIEGKFEQGQVPDRERLAEAKESGPDSLVANKLHFKVDALFDLFIERSSEAFDSLKELLPSYEKISLARDGSARQTKDSAVDSRIDSLDSDDEA